MKNLKIILISVVVLIVLVSVLTALSKRKPKMPTETGEVSAVVLYNEAGALLRENQLLKAKVVYHAIISDFPDFREISEVEKRLQDLNMRILFSPLATPKTTMYEVKTGDSLSKIAKKFHTTVGLIKRSNNLSSDVIKVGKGLRIWTGKFSCVVDKSQNLLTLMSDDELIRVYRVSTGANNHTPAGSYKIVNKLVNPVWYKDGRKIPPESPENILGTRWMGFNEPFSDYGIHGTTEPESIGKQVTQGCVRMLNKEVEELYSILPVGTEVTIID